MLCNPLVLVESFDEPEAEVCINAIPTLSRVRAEQRGGRVLRRSRIKDNKIGYILEVVDHVGDSENTPVLYSEIAGAAEILPPKMTPEIKTPKEREKKNVRKVKRTIEITPEVVDDPEEVMRLTNRNSRQRYTRMFNYAPKGWVHVRQLAKESQVREEEISIQT